MIKKAVTEEKTLTEQLQFPVEVFIRKNREDPMEENFHWHDCFEILYVLKGKAEYLSGAKQEIFPLVPGDFVLIRCREIHTIICSAQDETEILVVKFMPSAISSPYFHCSDFSYISAFLNSENVYHLESQEQNEIRKILESIYQEYSTKRKAYELVIRSDVYRLAAACIRHHMIILPEHVPDAEYQALLPALRFIEKNYATDITLHQISEMLHLNYIYTSRFFKKIVGKSFKQYLDYIRISEAEKLLLNSRDYIYIIAAKCGFSSQQTFVRTFKRIRGYSPKVKKRSFSSK